MSCAQKNDHKTDVITVNDAPGRDLMSSRDNQMVVTLEDVILVMGPLEL